MKSAFWKRDWFLGLSIALTLIIFQDISPIGSLELSAYDFGVSRSSRQPSDKIFVVAIDETSIQNIGRWPWSRDIHAQMINTLSEGGAKVIGYTPIFSEPQRDPGLQYIRDISELYNKAGLRISPATSQPSDMPAHFEKSSLETLQDLLDTLNTANASQIQTQFNNVSGAINEIGHVLTVAEQDLDVDKKLQASIAQARNIVLSSWFFQGPQLGNPDQALPDYLARNAVRNIIQSPTPYTYEPVLSDTIVPPLAEFGTHAAAIGNLNLIPDSDGGIRSEPLIIDYYGVLFPSYALMLAAKSLNLDPDAIAIKPGEGVQLGGLWIGTDTTLSMQAFFYSNSNGPAIFPTVSFYDVLTGKIPSSQYKNKIVIVGPSASGIAKLHTTPVDPTMDEVTTLAHIVSSILNEDFFTSPLWTLWVTIGAVLIVTVYLILILPYLGALSSSVTSAILLISILITHHILMVQHAIHIELMLPVLILVVGHVLLSTKRFLLTERGKQRSDLESAESNRMLGLAFQGQGQLDMAFEKFRKCPKDDALAEALYNLALDYERKRQFSKSGNVYQYIHAFNPKFRDVEKRMQRAKKMEDTVVLGGGGANTASGTLIIDPESVEKPMLGRYEVQKELGKGAMGIVYLGKDPKISRIVAIKTMALSQEFDADELAEVKERFFREAETAGRLNHPNIVTIYDAGEEHDLAYIAMEFLKGRDLSPFTKKENLLPLAKTLEIISKAASALSYAHSQNVVHRDIKPANIMYDPDSNQIKITDFGIARITDASKTKTGMVLGTPSYMSPEQLSGKKVDGRSDLYSLGVMLFQLVTGELPFKADSMASLMYKITNDPNPSILSYMPNLPRYLDAIITKSLEKNADNRYQLGEEMSKDIDKLRKGLSK